MLSRFAALAALLALIFAPAAGTWNKYATLDEVASWLAMRPVSVKCLNKWESEKDFVISTQDAAAYVEGFFRPNGEWKPNDYMVVAWPICNWFVGLVRGEVGDASASDVAFSVLVMAHESGHLRGWRKQSLTSESEASTQRWALRHIYTVARRIGLSHDASVLVLRYSVLFHLRLPAEYHAADCQVPFVDSDGMLRGCGK